jgi:hypothetical protein
MSNKIIQSDNAVIDYTTISVIIDTLNKQQKAIEDLQATINGTVTTVDPGSGKVTETTGSKKAIGSAVQIKGKTVKVDFGSNFTQKPSSLVGTVLSSTGTAAYAFVNSTITSTGASFTIVTSSKDYKGMYLYWMAYGI